MNINRPQFTPENLFEEEPYKYTLDKDDRLGVLLENTLISWRDAKKPQEEEWLVDMRAFNKVNEPASNQSLGGHKNVYIGMTFAKCLQGFSRIVNPLFGKDKHWAINRTPKPESFSFLRSSLPNEHDFLNEIENRAKKMETEIADWLVTMDYEKHLKTCCVEAVMLGTGCIKGVYMGIKTQESWQKPAYEWIKQTQKVVTPLVSSPSVWNIYVPPTAVSLSEIDKVFERHILTRHQLANLKNDPRFDREKIDRLLEQTRTGNYTPLYHETQRKNIVGESLTSYTSKEEFDVYEYTGSISGHDLHDMGYEVESTQDYWVNLFFCNSLTIAVIKNEPYRAQKLPYHFFRYTVMPYQFWGRGVAWMNRASQQGMNGCVRAALDNAAWAAHPLREVNVNMLKDGQDPNSIFPNHTFLRDRGDAAFPAIRFFQPENHSSELMGLSQVFDGLSDMESMVTRLSTGDSSNELNKTLGGMQMMLNVSSLSTETAVKNLEDGVIKPFIRSMFDFIMRWSDKEDIKGDFDIEVLVSSVLIEKSQRTQQLMQFSNVAASNPATAQLTDFKYLIQEIAKSLDIDPAKAVPDNLQSQMPQPQVNPLDQARAALMQVQAEKEKAAIEKIIAETAGENTETQFKAVQAALALLTNPQAVATAQELFDSAGAKDYNAPPVFEPQQTNTATPVNQPVQQNTHPQFPPNPASGSLPAMPSPAQAGTLQPTSPATGLQTLRNDGAV